MGIKNINAVILLTCFILFYKLIQNCNEGFENIKENVKNYFVYNGEKINDIKKIFIDFKHQNFE